MAKFGRSSPERLTLLAVLLLVLGGCATGAGRWTRSDYRLSVAGPGAEAVSEPLTSRIWLVSDNQRHELLGDGARLFRTAISDELTSVAIRPPQLDLFGQDLLREALTMADGFVLHLGDGCDISNTGEFGRFAWDMRRARQGWVMAPGNHDGFFFGNSSRLLPSLVREWDESAEKYVFDGVPIESRSLQKDRFVSYYLAALILQDAAWSGPLARGLGPEFEASLSRWRDRVAGSGAGDEPSFSAYWAALEALQEQIYDLEPAAGREFQQVDLSAELVGSARPHLRRIAWQIDKRFGWRSFLVQEVDITAPSSDGQSRTSILVLDSAQYYAQPSIEAGAITGIVSAVTKDRLKTQMAGLHGNVLELQAEAAGGFALAMEREGRRWMLATHHPYRDIAWKSKLRFDRLREAGGIPVTLSAHSHVGEILWNRDEDREGDWLEVNVGSILDAPVEFRDLQLVRAGDRIAVRVERHGMEERLRDRGLLADDIPAYRPVPGDPDYFMNYETRGLPGLDKEDWTAPQADFRVKQLTLAAYRRLFALFETDEPDQTGTYWPAVPDGARLQSHEAVLDAVHGMLADASDEDAPAITRFLAELREYDRTRSLSPALDEQRRAYRLSQAIWAGQAEQRTWDVESRGIEPAPTYLVLPPTAALGGRGRAE